MKETNDHHKGKHLDQSPLIFLLEVCYEGEVMSLYTETRTQNGAVPNYFVITLLLFWCALIVVSSVYVTTPLVNVFSADFYITKTMAAWPGSVFSLFYAIGFLVFGPLADRYGRKQIIVFGLGALTVATVLIGFTDQFLWLVILRGVQGFVAATFAPTALSYAFDVFPKEKLVTTIGFLSFGYLIAGIFGQVFSDILNQLYDWEIIFFVFGGLYFLSFIAVIHVLPNQQNQVGRQGTGYFFNQTKLLFKQKNLILCYITTVMLLLTFIGMYTVLGDYLRSSPFNLSEEGIIYVRAMGILGMLLSPFVGFFVNKFGLMVILKVGLGISVLGLMLLGIHSNLVYLVLLSIVYVSGISIIFPAIMMLIGELGGEHRATAASLYAFILFIGATLGPVIGIKLVQIGSYAMTFIVLSLLLLIGFIAVFFVKRE